MLQKDQNGLKFNELRIGDDLVQDLCPGFSSLVNLNEFSDNANLGFPVGQQQQIVSVEFRSPGGSSSSLRGSLRCPSSLPRSAKSSLRAFVFRSAWRTRSRRVAARRPVQCHTCRTSTASHSPPATRCTPGTPSSTPTHPPRSSRNRSPHAARTVTDAPAA